MYLFCINNYNVMHYSLKSNWCFPPVQNGRLYVSDLKNRSGPLVLFIHISETILSTRQLLTMSTCTHHSGFCPSSEKDNNLIKLFTCLMKMNIPLLFSFTCSCVCAYSDYCNVKQSARTNFPSFPLAPLQNCNQKIFFFHFKISECVL